MSGKAVIRRCCFICVLINKATHLFLKDESHKQFHSLLLGDEAWVIPKCVAGMLIISKLFAWRMWNVCSCCSSQWQEAEGRPKVEDGFRSWGNVGPRPVFGWVCQVDLSRPKNNECRISVCDLFEILFKGIHPRTHTHTQGQRKRHI